MCMRIISASARRVCLRHRKLERASRCSKGSISKQKPSTVCHGTTRNSNKNGSKANTKQSIQEIHRSQTSSTAKWKSPSLWHWQWIACQKIEDSRPPVLIQCIWSRNFHNFRNFSLVAFGSRSWSLCKSEFRRQPIPKKSTTLLPPVYIRSTGVHWCVCPGTNTSDAKVQVSRVRKHLVSTDSIGYPLVI